MTDWGVTYTMKNFGTFSTPTFAGVGEPFVDKNQGARPPAPEACARPTHEHTG